jgi:Arc/MetJ-type ribon-helix-helix transcriptional regulator
MIKLSPATEEILDRAVNNGHFQNREQAISEAVRLLSEQTEAAKSDDAGILPPAEWVREFRKWARSHKTRSRHLDDSREAIYEGRGE